ncbi:MAG: LPS export ABC transporter periplasmic protein LptC [Bacteroidales bacterium]|nr:LPS export ABC transporter periplasmic protein LptC [Bacteroidales bacterium]
MKKLFKIFIEINIIANMVMVLFSCENSLDKVKEFIDTDTINGVLAYNVNFTRSDSGFVQAKLMAPVMHNIEGDSSILEFPKGFEAYIFNRNNKPSSKIRGDYGIRYDKEELIFIRDSVVVEDIETKETMFTETLYWNQKTKKIYTRNFVKITSPDKIIYGDSLNANEDFSQRVIHGMRATLEIEDEE